MKPTAMIFRITRKARTAATALSLFALPLQDAQARTFTPVEVAWKEAVVLAGVAETSVKQPEIAWVGEEAGRDGAPAAEYIPDLDQVRIYRADGRAPYYVIVQEFLRSIYFQTRSTQAVPAAARENSHETWTRSKMGWRVSSPAFTRLTLLN